MTKLQIVSIKGVTAKTLYLMSLLAVVSIGFWKWIAPSIHDQVIGNPFALLGAIGPFIAIYLTSRIMSNTLPAKWWSQVVAFFLGTFLGLICGVAEMSEKSRPLIWIALTATLIGPLTLSAFMYFYVGNFPERLFAETAKWFRIIFLMSMIDCSLTVWVGHYSSITFGNNPISYALSFGLIIVGFLLFFFNLSDVREQIKNRTPESEEWADSFTLMISTFWIFITVFLFASRSRK